jgi:carbon-monoxide dehydrogenase small subunit
MEPRASVPIQFTLNGGLAILEVRADETALEALRERVGLKGTKEGCGMGECGACTIVVDGHSVNACLMLAAQLDGREVTTVEGLAGEKGLHPVQEAFLAGHGVQCGFCTPGMLMSAYALLQETADPGPAEVVSAISGNLCRCTGYQQIVTAILDAARRSAGKD